MQTQSKTSRETTKTDTNPKTDRVASIHILLEEETRGSGVGEKGNKSHYYRNPQ